MVEVLLLRPRVVVPSVAEAAWPLAPLADRLRVRFRVGEEQAFSTYYALCEVAAAALYSIAYAHVRQLAG